MSVALPRIHEEYGQLTALIAIGDVGTVDRTGAAPNGSPRHHLAILYQQFPRTLQCVVQVRHDVFRADVGEESGLMHQEVGLGMRAA